MTNRYERKIDCFVCRGTGKLFRKRKLPEPCQVCNGTGCVEVVH